MRSNYLALVLGVALALAGGSAKAAWDDWSLEPLTGSMGDLEYTVGGQAYGTVFDADQPHPRDFPELSGTGAATLNTRLERNYDSGLSLAVKGQFQLFHDRLSADNYGGKFLAKLYGTVQTGLGRVEVGMADGAAYALSVTGPVANPEVTIDNPNATFFRDPVTHGAFQSIFTLNSAVESSLNYAKISYFSPRLFGLQLGLTFTPSEGKDVVPFLHNGPDIDNRQKSLWEGAVNYSDSFGPITLSAYGGFTFGHGDRKTPGHAGLTEWGLGTEADWSIDDDTKLAVGGGYRNAHTYAFDINNALLGHDTQSMHLSTVLSRGSWSLGGEIGNGTTDASHALALPALNVHGYLVNAAYAVNTNLQLSGGWQKLNYGRSDGAFYNGAPRIEMDAVFLHAVLNI
jgi:hypothetical protein